MANKVGRGWQRASIYDVAKLAGVSHMTVSRVLNGHPNIRDTTRERVLAAIAETNYTRSSIARALATQRAMRIGVLVDSPVQYGPNSTLRAIENAARQRGYSVSSVSFSKPNADEADLGVAELVTQGVDGLCVIAPRFSSIEKIRKRAGELPMLVVQADSGTGKYSAAVDQRAGAVQAVEHLISLGHRKIAHLAGPLDWRDAKDRADGWRATLREAGLEVPAILAGDWSSNSGYEIGLEMDLSQTTAVFASNDEMAFGLMHALNDRGLAVPEQISIVGFDDLPDSKHFLPPLTTVKQDFTALGELVLRQLLALIEGRDEETGRLISPVLVVRDSTALVRREALTIS